MSFVSEYDYESVPAYFKIACNDNPKKVNKITIGVLFRLTAAWIGVHYSSKQRRICINPVPFVTIWIALKGGRKP